jgi:DNA repair photolyase
MRISRSEWGRTVAVKRNIPKVIAKELRSKKKGVVGISLTTDPYQPAEKKYKVTRLCLEQLARHDFPASILTKSPLITRDLDILRNFKEIEVGLTITTNSELEKGILEPNAPTIESRISALRVISYEGIETYAFMGPLYPTTTEEDLVELVGKLKDAGVSKIMSDRLNLRPGVWSSVSSALKENPEAMTIWQESVKGDSSRYDGLFHSLERICRKQGIVHEYQAY